MEYACLQNSFFSIQFDCENCFELDNVKDLYDCRREEELLNCWAKNLYQKQQNSSTIKKFNELNDYGDYEVSDVLLCLRQFSDYSVRLLNWRDHEDQELTVSVKIGMFLFDFHEIFLFIVLIFSIRTAKQKR